MLSQRFQGAPLHYHLALAAILVITALAYLPGLTGPFLFDDIPSIVANDTLTRAKHSVPEWWSASLSSEAGVLRRPLTMLSLAAQANGANPESATVFKLVNLFFHLACGMLVYALTGRLYQAVNSHRPPRDAALFALICSGLWLLSPLLVSTVLYPIQRAAQLSTLFTLSGLTVYAHYRLRWATGPFSRDEFLATALWVTLLTLAATLSKENGVLLPWLLVCLEMTVFRGLWCGSYRPRVMQLATTSFLLATSAFVLFFVLNWDWLVASYAPRDFTVVERLLSEARILWLYLGWLLLPRLGDLGLFHDDIVLSSDLFDPLTTLPAVVAWPACLILAWHWRRKFPWLLMGTLFFLVAHSVESSFLALEPVYEHRNYLPSVGVYLVVAGALIHLLQLPDISSLRRVTPVLVLGLYFGVSTLVRASGWSTQMQLASDGSARHPESERYQHFYANTLINLAAAEATEDADSQQLVAIARHHFEVMHQRDPRNLGALIMLFTLDSRLVFEIAQPARWLEKIREVVGSTSQNATEQSAMSLLMDCVAEEVCVIAPEVQQEIVDKFTRRYNNVAATLELNLKSMEILGVSEKSRREFVEAALRENPRNTALQYKLISAKASQGEYSDAHRVVLTLLRADPLRRQLTTLIQSFDASGNGGGPE